MKKVRFLNPDVESEVIKDKLLFIMWAKTYGSYDWEIDPLHNPDYVSSAKRREIKALNKMKTELDILTKEYNEYYS